jgi:purine-nucleoside phosphorylase
MSWDSLRPTWGLVLGSGLGSFVEQMKIVAEVPYDSVPGLPKSSVPGHAGKFVFGEIGGVLTVAAQGRVHLYEGLSGREVTAHVRWMIERGVKQLVLTNAAGTCNPEFTPGSWMMLRDHLNLTHTSPLVGGPNFFDMSEVYSARLRGHFAQAAEMRQVKLYHGVYAVGMSTVLEAIQARALGVEVAGFSCLTNWAAGLHPGVLGHEEVLETGRRAAGQLAEVLTHAIPSL